jgi:hypothetical protein
MKQLRGPLAVAVVLFTLLATPNLAPAQGAKEGAPDGETPEEGVAKLTDSNIEYFSQGQGEPVVLLPGGTLTVGYFDDLAAALSKSGFRVVRINFTGSGKSMGLSIWLARASGMRSGPMPRPT